jgi:Ca2+-binding EF-hand superfamily protein
MRRDRNAGLVQDALRLRVGASTEGLEKLFVEWDRNGDGHIDKNELRMGIDRFGLNLMAR